MRYAKSKEEVIDSQKLKRNQMKALVKEQGAVCVSCGQEVIYCSGPKKGSYFAHKLRSDGCQYYHQSQPVLAQVEETKEETEKVTPIIKETTQKLESILKRFLTKKEKEHLYSWLYYEDYQVSEIMGSLKEMLLANEDVHDKLFSRLDAKLFSITRNRNDNPYFKRTIAKSY